MKRSSFITATALVGLLATGAAHATIFSGSAVFQDNGPTGNYLSFSATVNNTALSDMNLSLNSPHKISNLLTITSTYNPPPSIFGPTSSTDNISTAFTFTQPSAGTGSLGGKGKGSAFFVLGQVFVSSGSIVWNNPGVITFADGAQLNVTLQNRSGINFLSNSPQTFGVNADFTMVQAPTTPSVPEPNTLALFAAGLLAAAVAVQRRRARQS